MTRDARLDASEHPHGVQNSLPAARMPAVPTRCTSFQQSTHGQGEPHMGGADKMAFWKRSQAILMKTPASQSCSNVVSGVSLRLPRGHRWAEFHQNWDDLGPSSTQQGRTWPDAGSVWPGCAGFVENSAQHEFTQGILCHSQVSRGGSFVGCLLDGWATPCPLDRLQAPRLSLGHAQGHACWGPFVVRIIATTREL